MANDKTVNIGITTSADTSGAENAAKSILKIEDAAKRAERELDVLEAKRRVAARGNKGVLGKDLTGGVGDGVLEGAARGIGYDRELDAAKRVAQVLGANVTPAIMADAVAIGGAFAAIGASAVASYNLVSGTVDGYKKVMADAVAAGQSIEPELEQSVANLESMLSPITNTIGLVEEKWAAVVDGFKNPIDTFSGLGALKESLKAAKEAADALQKKRLEIATDRQSDLTSIYKTEVDQLKEQERTIQRIAGLRGSMGGLAVQGARQEIESARLRGGDVGLAEANALAVELRAGLEKLGDPIRAAQAEAATVTREYDAALVLYQEAIRNGMSKLNPAEFQKLDAAVDRAKNQLDEANQAVSDQSKLFSEAKNNLLRGAENQLAQLEQEYDGRISKAAGNAFDGIYETIRSEVGKQSVDTAGRISEIYKQMGTASPEISGAFDKLSTLSAAKDERILGGLTSLATSTGSMLNRLAEAERQIAAISSRLSQ